ncbi:MAG: hypothetical protein PHF31_11905 [Methylobacter sp.]|jgi:hypothetical protein|nr:hypothetical protein [Methylobacter sp.]
MDGIVLRTDPNLDAQVRHLGYEPVNSGVDKTDKELLAESQDRLSRIIEVPDNQLSSFRNKHLGLAREIARKLRASVDIVAADIPPASDRVRTAAVYHRRNRRIYIDLNRLDSAQYTTEAVVHELAHFFTDAEDGEPVHKQSMGDTAGKVVSMANSGQLDDCLVGVRW